MAFAEVAEASACWRAVKHSVIRNRSSRFRGHSLSDLHCPALRRRRPRLEETRTCSRSISEVAQEAAAEEEEETAHQREGEGKSIGSRSLCSLCRGRRCRSSFLVRHHHRIRPPRRRGRFESRCPYSTLQAEAQRQAETASRRGSGRRSRCSRFRVRSLCTGCWGRRRRSRRRLSIATSLRSRRSCLLQS